MGGQRECRVGLDAARHDARQRGAGEHRVRERGAGEVDAREVVPS